jgi:hypothetical protein
LLCCAVLCCAVLCCAVLCCAVLCTSAAAGTSPDLTSPVLRCAAQALLFPYQTFRDGSMGFVSMNVSLNPAQPDVRVLAFEDHHDAMHCCAVMMQFPEYSGAHLSVGMIATEFVEQELVRGVDMGEDIRGIVVFRKGKLLLKVGMGMGDFIQSVVFQAAAQLSLERVGFSLGGASR